MSFSQILSRLEPLNGPSSTLIVLFPIIDEMVTYGVKCEIDSFRVGTFLTIASKMRENILGINIEAKHVQNKVKILKGK